MADTNEIPLGDVTPFGDTSVPHYDIEASPEDMDKLLAEANKRGVSPESEKFLKDRMSQFPTPKGRSGAEIPIGQVTPVKNNFADVKSGVTTHSPSLLGQANDALANLGVDPKAVGGKFVEYGRDISNIAGEAASYIRNFPAEHEVMEPGPVSEEEKRAAQLMGVPMLPGSPDGGFYGKKNPQTGEVELHHPPIYKMTPEQIQALNDRTLEQWGLDPKQERARGTAFARAEFDKDADPIANITANNAIGNWIQDQLNPKMAASKQYAAIQQTVQAQGILNKPEEHTKEEVEAAQSLVDYYKNTVGKGVIENTKELLSEIKKDPTTKLAQIAAGLEADPEILMLGKVRLGTLLNEAKIATLTADFKKAQEAADFTTRTGIKVKPKIGVDIDPESISGKIKTAQRNEILGNMVSEPVIGGLANVGLDREAQTKEKGFVTPGSEATPLAQGAALGGLAAAGESLRLIPKKGELPVDAVRPTTPPGGGPGESTKPGAPGEPLPPETPISKNSHVPYYGGVDANGKLIHLDENTPDVLPMKNIKGETVQVPVAKLVGWHERVEFPLMHLKGPMDSASLVDLLKRVQGEGTIPKAVIAKLKKGVSLSYPEAHEIATLAENQRVRTLYNVHPEVYQDGLKPYIKQVAEDNKKQPASNIPPTLDTKPYEDMGHEEVLKGQGTKPEDIGKKALAVGVVAAGGAAAGAMLSPDDREGGAKFGTFIPLLSRIFHGEEVGDLATMKRTRLMRKAGVIGAPAAKELSDKLDSARETGMSPRDIWQRTGYYVDGHGNWYREISDDQMRKKQGSRVAPGVSMTLSKFVDHPELAKTYPKLWDKLKIEFSTDTDPPRNAHFDPNTYTIHAHPNVPIDIVGHEVQHAIQTYEGLPMGASYRLILNSLKEERNAAIGESQRLLHTLRDLASRRQPLPEDLRQAHQEALSKLKRFPSDEKGLELLAYEKYSSVMGEVQAFASQGRIKLTPEERLQHPPSSDMPPLEDQWDSAATGDIVKHEVSEDNKLPNEDDHIRLAAAGNQRSIGALYNHYMPRLTRVMDRFMRQAGPRLGLGGEDVAQRAFFKAIQSLPDFKGGSSFYTWLYSIGRNEALNAITSADREVPTESMFKAGAGGSNKPGILSGHVGFGGEDTGSDPVKPSVQGAMSGEETPESLNAGHQISQLVRQTIATLPKNIADVLRLREIEGMTDVETARALKMNVSTVRTNTVRGREYLARAFQGTETEKLFRTIKGPKSQGGFADVESLKKLAKFAVLAGGGAAIGANYFDPQHPYKSMVQGASLALMAGQIKWGNVFSKFKDSMKYDPAISARDQLNQYDHEITRGERLTATTVNAIDGLVKTEEQRVKIARWLDGDKTVQLTPEEAKAAKIAQDVYSQTSTEALKQGVLHDFLQQYLNLKWKPGPVRDRIQAELKKAFQGPPKMAPAGRAALIKQFLGLSEGKALGMDPVSEDVNVLLDTYIRSITKAIANKNLVDSLRTTSVDGGKTRLIMAAHKAPYSYVAAPGSQLSKYRIHPSIAPSLEFLYQAHEGGAVVQAIEATNTALKRIQVSLSLFHAKSLLDAHLGAGEFGHPWRNFVDAAQSAAGTSRGHEAYLQGGVGDDIDHLIRSLKITPRRGTIPVEDVTSGFYEGLKVLQDAMDSIIPKSGKYSVGLVTGVSKALDHLLWENVHSGLKLITGMNVLERLRRSYAKEFEKNPDAHVPSTAELADRAGSYVNDVFGGLNWRRLADDATTHWGHELGSALANPTGRRIAQVMMFAPDWTYSTVRSVVKARGPGSGVKGLLHPKQIADLHRMYLIRSALIYATLYNGINMALSGHPIWENQRNGKPEPFLVDLGNGEWAQANKHAMEVPNLVAHPMKWAMGKLGNIPSEAMEQALGKEYLSPDYMPPMKEGRIAHVARRLLPFSGTSYLEQGWKEALSSALGVPIYGKTLERQEELKEERKAQRKEETPAKRDAKKQKRIELLLGGDH